jgi:hypothetical protein
LNRINKEKRNEMNPLRKSAIVLVALGLLTFGFSGPAQASGDHEESVPRHGHVLVLNLHIDENEEVTGFCKCVDLARGKALKNNAHHEGAHEGKAGYALFVKAGHGVAPTAPLWPEVGSCADLEAMFGK